MSDCRSDIVVIGAGIAGLVAAHECLERGKSVTLVDRHDEANVGGLARTAFGGMALIDWFRGSKVLKVGKKERISVKRKKTDLKPALGLVARVCVH